MYKSGDRGGRSYEQLLLPGSQHLNKVLFDIAFVVHLRLAGLPVIWASPYNIIRLQDHKMAWILFCDATSYKYELDDTVGPRFCETLKGQENFLPSKFLKFI